jgi:hypothetical protein
MAGLDWSLLNTDPIKPQREGFAYAQAIQQAAQQKQAQQAQMQAGDAYAKGDYAGASQTLARSGDIKGAQSVQETQQKSGHAGLDYVSKALPVFKHIAQTHASDPDGGAQAIGQAFDNVAQEFSAITGTPPDRLAQIKSALIADPQGTLARWEAELPVAYEKVGNSIVRRQGDTAAPIYTGQPNAPAGYQPAPDGKGLQFIPGGPGDPKQAGNLAEARRMVIVNNPVPQRAAGPGGKAPAGYRWTEDGELEVIPGGPADKLTDDQSKAVGYGSRLSASSDIIDQNEAYGTNFLKANAAKVPLFGNFMVGTGYQNLDQAERDFVNALLRRESGAAISESEFNNARLQYFPQPGDSKQVLAQKRAARRRGIENMRVSSGRGADKIPAAHSQASAGGNVIRYDAQGNRIP